MLDTAPHADSAALTAAAAAGLVVVPCKPSIVDSAQVLKPGHRKLPNRMPLPGGRAAREIAAFSGFPLEKLKVLGAEEGTTLQS